VNKPGGERARGDWRQKSQGTKEPGANQPGGETAKGEKARHLVE